MYIACIIQSLAVLHSALMAWNDGTCKNDKCFSVTRCYSSTYKL